MRRPPWCLVLVALMVSGLAASAQAQAAKRQACASHTDQHALQLLAYVKHLVSNPRLDRARASLGIELMDTAMVAPVVSDSICQRAARVISRHLDERDGRGFELYMVQFGKRFWAESLELRMGEYLRASILNADLTVVDHWAAR